MKEIIISYLLAFIITIISSLIYTTLGYNNINVFINNYVIYILLIYYIIVIIYLYNKNKKKENCLHIKNYFPLIILGALYMSRFSNALNLNNLLCDSVGSVIKLSINSPDLPYIVPFFIIVSNDWFQISL